MYLPIQVRQHMMGVQDMEEKRKLILNHLSLSNITECYMERKLIEVANAIHLLLSFLKSISIMLSIGFNLT
jgi:hypothetical protein